MTKSTWRKSRQWQQLSTQLIPLKGGQLEIARLGDPEGIPLLFFHGWPSSLCQAQLYHEAARAQGFQLISLNRPGIGSSCPRPGMSLQDWPAIMQELLFELGHEHAAILGISGGAPFALACGAMQAAHFPQISIVSSAPPLGGKQKHWRKDAALMYQILGGLTERFPKTMETLLDSSKPLLKRRPPWWLYQLGGKFLCSKDQIVISNPSMSEYSFGSFQGAISAPARVTLEEGNRYLQDWGFGLEEVCAPVTVWHGKRDKNFHWNLAERLVEAIPQGKLQLLEDHGHYSLPTLLAEDIFAEIRHRWQPQESRKTTALSQAKIQN